VLHFKYPVLKMPHRPDINMKR